MVCAAERVGPHQSATPSRSSRDPAFRRSGRAVAVPATAIARDSGELAREIKAPLENIFAGEALKPIVERLRAIHQEVLRGRVWVALHMHAGDGNVHTNIPVNSDNYEMLQRPTPPLRIMRLARALDGVISGEHGIGLTKLEFLTDDEIAPFQRYKNKVDPRAASTRALRCCPAAICAMPIRHRSACSAANR